MGVKYASADKVTVQGDKAVVSEHELSKEEATKLASDLGSKKASKRRAVVTNKEHRLTDEDHIPGDR